MLEEIGRYQVKAELGRGGMATVYLAEDPLIGREVAIKVLPREFLHDTSFRSRFEREARTIAMLEHPAIVSIYDFGEQDSQPYLVMRYMKGGSLADLMRKGSVSLGRAAAIMERLASALDHAHQNGVIHRDLKPGNILFDEFGDAYLSDFGIVKLAQETATLTGEALIGTPAYMSPEQIHGDQVVDGRSDIYALGIILFEMLTGRAPYAADTPAKLMMAHVLAPIPRIHDLKPELPYGCNTLILQALAKDPDNRFSTAGQLSQALKKTLTREEGEALQAALTKQLEEAEGDDEPERKGASSDRPATPPPLRRQATPSPKPRSVTPPPQQRPSTPPPQRQSAAPSPVSSAATEAPPLPDFRGAEEATPERVAGRPTGRRLIILLGGLAAFLALCCVGIFVLASLRDRDPVADDDEWATVAIVEDTGEEATPSNTLATNVARAAHTATAAAAEANVGSPTADSAATATTEAREAAIATRVAESTAAAEGATATSTTTERATVRAATRVIETTIGEILRARRLPPDVGPLDGSLVHAFDGFIKSESAEVDTLNFIADVTFHNPYGTDEGAWDIGYLFREDEINSQYRLTIESNGEWTLVDRNGDDATTVARGETDNLNTGAGESNRVTLVVRGPLGFLFVNEGHVASLDLSHRQVSGDIAIATSMIEGNEIEGAETRYEAYSVWLPARE